MGWALESAKDRFGDFSIGGGGMGDCTDGVGCKWLCENDELPAVPTDELPEPIMSELNGEKLFGPLPVLWGLRALIGGS